MGKNRKLHKMKVQARNAALNNPVARKAISIAAKQGVINELSAGSVDDQSSRLQSLVGTGQIESGYLKRSIISKAPKQMDDGIRKFIKKGLPVTVATLTEEVRHEDGFLKMCASVGITIEYFENLARERMEHFGIEEVK